VQPDADGQESIAETTHGHSEKFEFVDDSFVRDQPQPNAAIIATLQPGTRVAVEGKTNAYLRIHSLSDADVIGYVHEQDAFFQAIK
jgi:Bacterial SH3 domain